MRQIRHGVGSLTDERASKVTNSQDIYFDEEEALDNFIDRLRALNRLRGL